jgi:nondiscriminating glutamyl-tRNA synthetase
MVGIALYSTAKACSWGVALGTGCWVLGGPGRCWPAGRKVSRSPAVLDLDKLNRMNQQYVKKLSLQELSDRLQPFIAATSYADRVARLSAPQREWLMEAVRERMVCLKDIENLLPVFFDPPAKDEEAQAVLSQPGARQVLETIQAKLPLKEDPEEYRQYIGATTVKEFKLKAKDVFMPVRCALTGLVHGPDLYLIMAVWGRQETARRLEKSLTGLTVQGNACGAYIVPAILYSKRG